MSSVMQALQRSEHQYQQNTLITQDNPAVPFQRHSHYRWRWFMACLMLPTVLVLGYQYVTHSSLAHQRHYESVMPHVIASSTPVSHQSHRAAKLASSDGVLVTELSYPQFVDLKTTQKIPLTPKAGVIPKNIVTSKVMATPNNPELAVESQSIQSHPPSYQSDVAALTDGLDFDEVSPELTRRFQQALQAPSLEVSSRSSDATSTSTKPALSDFVGRDHAINLVTHQAQFQGRLPTLNLQGHMYSSNVKFSSVKINQHEFFTGDWITPKVKLVAITPQTIEVQFEQQRLSIPALFEWQP